MSLPTAPHPAAHPHRSPLVATWAAFFGRLGWRVETDPGVFNGWFPSFAIHGRDITTLAEVRPMDRLSPVVAANALGAAEWVPIYPNYAESPKAIAHSILLLGESPLAPLTGVANGKAVDKASLGWIYDGVDALGVYEGGCGDWQVAYLLGLPAVSPGLGFSGLFGNWTDRISGQHFNMMTDSVERPGRNEIARLWADCAASVRASGG